MSNFLLEKFERMEKILSKEKTFFHFLSLLYSFSIFTEKKASSS
jgi:hypothetical protein